MAWNLRAGARVNRLKKQQLPGGYRVAEPIQKGDFSVVYRGKDPSGQPVAIKIPVGQAPIHAARLESNAYALQQLSGNPNVPAFRHLGRSPAGHPFLVTELVQGYSLRWAWKKGAADERQTAALMLQVSNALAQLHDMGAAHTAVSADNIMVDVGRGRFVLHGFSQAMLAAEPTQLGPRSEDVLALAALGTQMLAPGQSTAVLRAALTPKACLSERPFDAREFAADLVARLS